MVFVDRDSDCVKGSDEESLSGVTIELLDANGNVLRSTSTDSDGRYRFENLPQGKYTIREIGPAGYFHFQQMAPAGRANTLVPFLIQDLQLQSASN